jgi:putative Mg2+ transporter-C (MgtC) family protein
MPIVQHIHDVLLSEIVAPWTVAMRVADLRAIAYAAAPEREWRLLRRLVRTNLLSVSAPRCLPCSDALAVRYLGDHTRIAAQIIPGIGFIGAGSILHNRGSLVTGITSAATLFVVASIGMAVGGGLYLTAIFGTGLILICLFLLGNAEQKLNLKLALHSSEVTGRNADDIKAEVNAALECIHAIMENVHVAETRQHVRLQFDLEGTRKEQQQVLQALKQSSILDSVIHLGPVQPE